MARHTQRKRSQVCKALILLRAVMWCKGGQSDGGHLENAWRLHCSCALPAHTRGQLNRHDFRRDLRCLKQRSAHLMFMGTAGRVFPLEQAREAAEESVRSGRGGKVFLAG